MATARAACVPSVRRAGAEPWKGHFVDIGLSIGGTYFRLVVGRERRAPERRKRDRDAKPLSTIGNMLFAGSISGVVFSVLSALEPVFAAWMAFDRRYRKSVRRRGWHPFATAGVRQYGFGRNVEA